MSHVELVRDQLQGQSYQELLRTPDGELSVAVATEVSEDDRQHVWEMIETGFQALNSRSFERQSMAFDEFIQEMDAPDVLKFISRDADGVPDGYLSAHVGLDDVTWANTELLAKRQEQTDPAATPFYIGTLVVPPETRGTETAANLVRSSLRFFRDVYERSGRNALAFFDCAEANHPWLAEYVRRLAEPGNDFEGVPIEVEELGVQYWAEDLQPEHNGHVIRKVLNDSLGIVAPSARQGGYVVRLEKIDDPQRYHVLDTQHFYAIELQTSDHS